MSSEIFHNDGWITITSSSSNRLWMKS